MPNRSQEVAFHVGGEVLSLRCLVWYKNATQTPLEATCHLPLSAWLCQVDQ